MFENFQIRQFKKRRRIEEPAKVRLYILGDRFLRKIYLNILQIQLQIIDYSDITGPIAELGSAGGITKDLNQQIITTDVREDNTVDIVLKDDLVLPFADSSLRAVIAKDTLHHIPNVDKHFKEVERVLKPGGVAVYAEPNWNLISKIVFTLFHPEPYVEKQIEWRFDSSDPMYSNQAIPYIIFVRDSELFKHKYPNLEVEVRPEPLNGLSFLMSGGVMSRTPIPTKLLLWLDRLESRYLFLNRIFGTLRIIVIKKSIN